MLFNSLDLIFLFMPATLAAFAAAVRLRSPTVAVLVLLVTPYVFYGYGGHFAVLLLAGSAAFNYVIGWAIAGAIRREERTPGSLLLGIGVCGDLALLAHFKYAGFLMTNLDQLTFPRQVEHAAVDGVFSVRILFSSRSSTMRKPSRNSCAWARCLGRERCCRDYFYIALGGNRKGQARRYVNLMTTLLVGGLWHGAGWTFVIWGGLHGLYLVANHLLRTARPPRAPAWLSWPTAVQ